MSQSVTGWLVAALLAVLFVALLFLVFIWRARTLSGRIGSFQCSLRRVKRANWQAGIAQYGVDRLDWFRFFSFMPRPAVIFRRGSLRIVDAYPAKTREGQPIPQMLRVECDYYGRRVSIAMSPSAYAGLASWLEGAAPQEQYRLY